MRKYGKRSSQNVAQLYNTGKKAEESIGYINADLREIHIIGNETREYLIGPQASQAFAPYAILLAGISYALPPFRFVRPDPQMCQLLVCLEGRGAVLVDGEWRICEPGMAYLTPPHVPHAYHALDDESARPWKLCWVLYDARDQERVMIALDAPRLLPVDAQGLAAAIEGLYHECIGPAEEALMHTWVHLIQTYARRLIGQEQFDGRLDRLWKLVDANLAHPWHGEELAATIDVSGEHLRRLCQQQAGHSPMRHVTELRMRRAMALLTGESFSVEDVARRVGYENPFAFSTAFKRYTGIAPSIYREKQRNGTS